jgi:hypothetical protein
MYHFVSVESKKAFQIVSDRMPFLQKKIWDMGPSVLFPLSIFRRAGEDKLAKKEWPGHSLLKSHRCFENEDPGSIVEKMFPYHLEFTIDYNTRNSMS